MINMLFLLANESARDLRAHPFVNNVQNFLTQFTFVFYSTSSLPLFDATLSAVVVGFRSESV